ncbi:CinA family protein [Candidatus Cryosericum terrychapinii]|jgi:nicotinamide-nucleotide amidase|uniref:CinA family protein n=1 Tax=Candidatus Cryosericum terrychapinii TaxID=2290919 RepID=A0A398CWF9_9BACT|nr:CinA family protein [Candidatus Cryosericum terrychapinii]RIE06873.1 CinA family protein [Candidatus Cryosericum terrychapinii]
MSEDANEDLLAVAGALLSVLAQHGWCLGTAESLTGGMVGAAITAVPGASVSYMGGVIGYADREKTALLGVPVELLKQRGADSAEVAEAMAQGCRERLNVQVGLATTGVAGPASDDRGTPVGTVFVACATPRACTVERLLLDGDRLHIRVESTRAALRLAIRLVAATLPGAEEMT